jgi:hypothetical protein
VKKEWREKRSGRKREGFGGGDVGEGSVGERRGELLGLFRGCENVVGRFTGQHGRVSIKSEIEKDRNEKERGEKDVDDVERRTYRTRGCR